MDINNPFAKKTLSVEGDFCGRKLVLEVNRLAFRADAAVLVTCGETVVLGTVCVGDSHPNSDYFPFSVDYEERFYASGKISGSRYIKREGRPSDDAVLTSRLIDRPIRPLFPKGYRNEVQAIATVLSLDPEVKPDAIAMIAISAALSLTGAPFAGPVAGVRVGLVDGELKAYPNTPHLLDGGLNIMVASNQNGVMMVEAGANEIDEAMIVEAMNLANQANQSAIELQKALVDKVGVTPMEYELALPAEEIMQEVQDWAEGKLGNKLAGNYAERTQKIEELIAEFKDFFADKLGEEVWANKKNEYHESLHLILNKDVRHGIIVDGSRPDGRALNEVRSLSSQVGVLPRTHGSSIFTRGATQALNIVTIAPMSYSQSIDTMERNEDKYYMHHYNAPGYTLGETRRGGSPGRREIGHSYLAERAIIPVLPDTDKFPYAIRSVTEIMSQHGSTSMAATCSSCLALMDAGVPLTAPVSGIAMGLIMKDDGQPIVLTDIQDAEDFAGDMDFKVTGTTKGITALQMDMKVSGLQVKILEEALNEGKAGRHRILAHMLDVIDRPRAELSSHAPRVEVIKISPAKIKDVIGKGGATIQGIVADTGAQIDIEDDGTVRVFCSSSEGMTQAKEKIKSLTEEPEVGTIYENKPVVRIMDFGVFVNIMPGTDGMVHVSEMADSRVEHPSDVVKEGDKVTVKLMSIDDKGRLSLSMKKAK